MGLTKKTGEKLENYFSRLVAEGYKAGDTYQGISLQDIETVLNKLDQFSADKRDAIWCLLNDQFPSPFAKADGFLISDGASTAQIGCYVGIFMRNSGKLDREGRDYWLKPLTDIAAIEPVTFQNGVFIPGHLKAKSPNSAYRLTQPFIKLLQSVNSKEFEETLSTYISDVDERLAVFAQLEEQAKASIGDSAHKTLILDSINVYAKTFLPRYEAVFTDYADGDRVSEQEKETLKKYGIVFGTIEDLWPDAILYNQEKESLWFIEAVTSDGEADLHKIDGLKAICKNSNKKYGGTTTTYETWKRLAARQQSENNLAPGSYVWIRECPNKQFLVD